MFSLLTILLSTTILRCQAASSATDASRLGQYYTSLPLYRSGSGTNVLTVGVGTPAVDVNLTVC
jgi:hypothetical protein